jgi:hypothetical protein
VPIALNLLMDMSVRPFDRRAIKTIGRAASTISTGSNS